MSTLLKIASKVFVRTFYIENTSFFLLVLGVAGGFMRDVEHIALAGFFVSKWYLVSIPFFTWILYGSKILNFNSACLLKPANNFFFQAILLPKNKLFLITALVVGAQLSPAILYGVFLAATAVKFGLYDSLFSIIACIAFLWITLTMHFTRSIQRPDQDKKTSTFIRTLNRIMIRPYPLFVIEWLSRKKTFTLLGIKLFSIFILVSVSKLYATDVYDFRLMGMALLIVLGANAQLVFDAHRFENHHFVMARQLPITLGKRIFFMLISLLLIILPEAGIFITYFPNDLTMSEMFQGLFFVLAGLFFWYGLLYHKKTDPEGFMKIVFTYTMAGIVLCLFQVPVWLLTAAGFLLSLYWHNKYYYRFEYPAAT